MHFGARNFQAEGNNSKKTTASITPATTANSLSMDSTELPWKNKAATNAPKGSVMPEASVYMIALPFDFVAAYTGKAMQTPSGTLCKPMANTITCERWSDFRVQ